MRTLSTDTIAALEAGHAALVTLVKIEFPSATIYLNSSTWDIVYDGNTYRGAHGLGSISEISDAPGELPGLELELLNTDPANIALALDDADEVQGSRVTIMTAIFDVAIYQVLVVEVDWVGYADKMGIAETGETATIGMTAESKAVDLLRGNPLTYSDGDQRSLHATDRAFEYIGSQSESAVIWPSREYFQK